MARLLRDILLLLAGLALVGCETQSKGVTSVDQFAWIPTASAPAEYPMWIVQGDIILPGGDIELLPARQQINNGWGVVGTLRIEGEELKPIPTRLKLSVYSMVEDKFFAGEFALPQDRMAALFRAGAPQPDGTVDPYVRVIVGVAPGGQVAVWLASEQVVTIVAHFTAAPADLPWTSVSDNAEVSRADFRQQMLEFALSPELLAKVTAMPVPVERWAAGRPAAWTPQFSGTSAGALLWLRGLDGAKDWIDLADPTRRGASFAQGLPLPAEMTVDWRGTAGPLRAEIMLDPNEVRAAFTRLAAGEQGAVVLRIEPAGDGSTVDLLLQRGTELYRFTRTQVKVFGG